MTKPKWRMLFSFLAILVVLAIGVACGDDDDSGGTTPAAGGTTATGTTAAAKPSGTITAKNIQFESWDASA